MSTKTPNFSKASSHKDEVTPMEYMREVVLSLSKKLDEIESKVVNVEELLKNQEKTLKERVMEVKNEWVA